MYIMTVQLKLDCHRLRCSRSLREVQTGKVVVETVCAIVPVCSRHLVGDGTGNKWIGLGPYRGGMVCVWIGVGWWYAYIKAHDS